MTRMYKMSKNPLNFHYFLKTKAKDQPLARIPGWLIPCTHTSNFNFLDNS